MARDERDLRLFIAIELPENTRRELARTIDALRAAGAGDALRWVRPEGIHITLKFLGATPPAKLNAIESALAEAVSGERTFALRPDGVGSFGGRRNLRVVWIGVGGDTDELATLAARVEAAIAPFGYPTEQRAFRAHLTLARVREDAPPQERERLHELLKAFDPPPFSAFHVKHVSLMQSTLSRGGAVYRALATFALEKSS